MRIKVGLIVILTLCLPMFRFWQMTGCNNFIVGNSFMRSVVLEVETQRLYDADAAVAKFFHNKLFAVPHVIALDAAKYFEPKYLFDTVGPLILVMSAISAALIVKRKIILGYVNIAMIAALSVFGRWLLPPMLVFTLNALYLSLAAFSFPYILKNRKRIFLYGLMWVFTLWYFFINWKLGTFCNEVIFK